MILYGDLIPLHRRISELFLSLSPTQRRKVDIMLQNQLPGILEHGYAKDAKILHNTLGRKSLFQLGNKAGQRVVFTTDRLGDQKRLVVLKVMGYDKAQQDDALSVVTDKTKSFLKKRGKV